MGQILELRDTEYEILDRAEVHQLTAADQLGRPLRPATAIDLLQRSAANPSTMRSLRLAFSIGPALHGVQRRSDGQVVSEFARLLRSGHFTLRPSTIYPKGNAGRFIVELERTRINKPINPTVISVSRWQVVKTVPGTWLTAIARYGLKPPWRARALHRVYGDEWVQKCEPVDPARDTEPRYTFWKAYAPGGRWDRGTSKPPRDPKPGELRDTDIEVGSYWCFKMEEIARFTLPDMDTDLLKKRQKLFDVLFEQALGADEKKRLLNRLNQLEMTGKAVGRSLDNERSKREKFEKLLEDAKQEVKKNAANGEVNEAIEAWYELALRSLDESVRYKESMEKRVLKEIDYLKFRSAEYDTIGERDPKLRKVQKGTSEEHQWKKSPSAPRRAPSKKPLPPAPAPAPRPARTGVTGPAV